MNIYRLEQCDLSGIRVCELGICVGVHVVGTGGAV